MTLTLYPNAVPRKGEGNERHEILTAAIVAFTFSTSAAATDMSVFGLSLGQKLSIPECEKTKYGYSLVIKQACYQSLSAQKAPVVTGTILIKIPIKEIPGVIKGDTVSGQVVDGNLEAVGFNTRGISDQESALDTLQKKYGKPSAYEPRAVQNQMGATYNVFTAGWEFSELVITFQSVTDTINSGMVNIDTRKGLEYRNGLLKGISKDKRAL